MSAALQKSAPLLVQPLHVIGTLRDRARIMRLRKEDRLPACLGGRASQPARTFACKSDRLAAASPSGGGQNARRPSQARKPDLRTATACNRARLPRAESVARS